MADYPVRPAPVIVRNRAVASAVDTSNTELAAINTKLTALPELITAATTHICTHNSTSTPLNAGATFTGTAEDVTGHPATTVACYTDQAGTLYVDFSVDGTNWDSTLSYSVSAATNEVHRLTNTRQYMRVRFTNTSASNQTYLRLQTANGSYVPLTAPLNLALQQDADSMAVREVSEDFDIAQGKRTGYIVIDKFGYNQDVDAAEDIWDGGGDYTGFPTGSAETVDVISSSANDTAAGTGARTITIYGLDANYAMQSETLTLNGATGVTSANTYMRVYRAVCATAGSGATNAGTLTIRHTTTTANIFAVIIAGYGQTNVAAMTVPAGYKGYVKQYHGQILDSGTNQALMAFWVRPYGGATLIRNPGSIATDKNFDRTVCYPMELAEKTDVKVRCLEVVNANARISAQFALVLVKQ